MAMTGSRQRERWLAFAAVAVVPALVVIAPILTFLVMSLFRVENNQIVREVNLANYAEVFGNPTYRGTFVGSLWLCVQVAAFTLLIGYPVAWFVWRRRGRGAQHPAAADRVAALHELHRETLRVARGAGLNGLLNQALVGMGILDEPSKAFLYNQRAVLMTMTVIFLPFVILPVFISLERIPSRLLEASTTSEPPRCVPSAASSCPSPCRERWRGRSSCSCWRWGTSSRRRWWGARQGSRTGG